MSSEKSILVINIGSTSTKIAVYRDTVPQFSVSIRHKSEELSVLPDQEAQNRFRTARILQALEENNCSLQDIDVIAARGGLEKPMESGTYRVNRRMRDDLAAGRFGFHPVNLSCIIAYDIAEKYHIPAYTVDPTTVDELDPVARVTGRPDVKRYCIWHALNQKAIARRYASGIGRRYEDLDLIVAHIGGGVTIGAHRHGRVIDVNNALEGEGPFTVERAGRLPYFALASDFLGGRYHSLEEFKKEMNGGGGAVAWLGTNSGPEICERIRSGDEKAKLVYEAMAYQISRDIGACAATLSGRVDAVLLTGGLSYDELLTGWIRDRVSFIAPVQVIPGEDEMGALAEGVLRVLRGEEQEKDYGD